MIRYTSYHSPIGDYTIGCSERSIVSLSFGRSAENEPCALSELAAHQIAEYLDGKRQEFTLPIEPRGSEFQLKVLFELCRIPYGQTHTYGEIARLIGNPRASRAVGGANHNNPIAILIPCHRVVGANGIGGYNGGEEIKRFLLELEAKNKKHG